MRSISSKIQGRMKALSQKKSGIASEKIVDIGEYQEVPPLNFPLDDEDLARELMELHPEFYAYMRGVEWVVGFSQCLCPFPELSQHCKMLLNAEEKYLPGSPFSNVFDSYFNYWSHFDAVIGRTEETLGTVADDIVNQFDTPEPPDPLIKNLNVSRMGIYVHEGISGNVIQFREVLTNKKHITYTTSHYEGKEGEIWFLRLLPCLEEESEMYIMMTTPYVIKGATEEHWILFFERNKVIEGQLHSSRGLYRLMKYGKRRHYWIDYIANTSASYGDEVIFLRGMPYV